MSNLINLYVDESGNPYVGDPRYRFFLITAVTMNQDQDSLAGSLMLKWRNDYLTNPSKCFHAVDFFEDIIANYKKRELRMSRHFNKAVKDLLMIMSLIKFSAEVYYVDLKSIRTKYRVGPPPIKPAATATAAEKTAYRSMKKIYHEIVLQRMGKNKEYYPLKLCLYRSFQKHSNLLQANTDNKGCINFESLGPLDGRYVDIYHNYASSDNNYKHGSEIVGMNLHTKASIEGGGIEIADFISYVSTQTLRSAHKLKNELATIEDASLKQIRDSRKFMREELEIRLVNVTMDAV